MHTAKKFLQCGFLRTLLADGRSDPLRAGSDPCLFALHLRPCLRNARFTAQQDRDTLLCGPRPHLSPFSCLTRLRGALLWEHHNSTLLRLVTQGYCRVTLAREHLQRRSRAQKGVVFQVSSLSDLPLHGVRFVGNNVAKRNNWPKLDCSHQGFWKIQHHRMHQPVLKPEKSDPVFYTSKNPNERVAESLSTTNSPSKPPVQTTAKPVTHDW